MILHARCNVLQSFLLLQLLLAGRPCLFSQKIRHTVLVSSCLQGQTSFLTILLQFFFSFTGFTKDDVCCNFNLFSKLLSCVDPKNIHKARDCRDQRNLRYWKFVGFLWSLSFFCC